MTGVAASSADARQWRTRPCEERDFPRWQGLYRGYAEFYAVDQSETDRARVWTWIADPAQAVECLVVESREDGVVGIAHYRPFARPLSATVGCFLDDLFVDPLHRGSGAADALLTALRDMARARDWSVIRWITAETNYRARALYDRHAARTAWVTYDMAPSAESD
jgi:GNAT superfamily N-acetyltransferase